jgi:hypothetical protein
LSERLRKHAKSGRILSIPWLIPPLSGATGVNQAKEKLAFDTIVMQRSSSQKLSAGANVTRLDYANDQDFEPSMHQVVNTLSSSLCPLSRHL